MTYSWPPSITWKDTHIPQCPPVPVKAVVGPAYLEGLRLACCLARHLCHQHDARVAAAAPLSDCLVHIEATAG
jgi:hypothetical protein